MALRPSATGEFKRDRKRVCKRGKNLEKLIMVMTRLVNQEVLEHKYRDHKLAGNFSDHRECHLEPDWLLVYRVMDDEIVFVRTGTHSDLFRR